MKSRLQWLSCLALTAVFLGCAALGHESKTGWNGFSPPPGINTTNEFPELADRLIEWLKDFHNDD